MNKWVVSLVVLCLSLGGVYVFRMELMLEGIGILAKRRADVGEHQTITWQSAAGPVSNTEGKPNIVLILADDMGFNDITFHGGVAGGTVPTPNIDSIAEQGAVFRNGYAANATCAPSRAALMSGKYPTRFGFEFTPTPPNMMSMIAAISETPEGGPELITHFDEAPSTLSYENMGLPTEETTLAEVLKAAGYYTAHIGKWHLGRENGMLPNDQGFDDSLLMASGLYMETDDPEVVNSKQDFDPIDRFLWKAFQYAASFNGSDNFKPDAYLTDYYTDEAVKVIEQNKDRPFFLYLAHWAPHTPLQASRADYEAVAHIKDHRLRVYAAMIRALDRGIGRVLEALEENQLSDNTIVIFTSDNGGAGYVGLPEINAPYRGWKMSFFEGGVHVPYFIKWPKKIKPGTEVTEAVHHFDIFATAAAAANQDITELQVNGMDLLDHIDNADTETEGVPRALFWRSGHYQMVLEAGWKLQRSEQPGITYLYNLMSDPTEQDNLAADYPARVAAMNLALDEHNNRQMAPRWPAQLEGVIPIDRTGAGSYVKDETYIYWPN